MRLGRKSRYRDGLKNKERVLLWKLREFSERFKKARAINNIKFSREF